MLAELLVALGSDIRLENSNFVLEIRPETGRVRHIGFQDGPNLLWEPAQPADLGGWINHGGDKLWFSPQSAWNWPPDPDLDGRPWTARREGMSVHMVSPISRQFGIRLERRITLTADGVLFRNRLINLGLKPVDFAPWQVTQIIDPDWVRMDVAGGLHRYEDRPLIDGYNVVDGETLWIRRNRRESRKFGTGSPTGTITARIGDTLIEMVARYEPGATYPDQGSAQQVFTADDPHAYVELELTGPLAKVAPGRSVELTVHLRLSRPARFPASPFDR